MEELPANWLRTTLGNVIDYADNTSINPSDLDPNAWLLELEDIERDTSTLLNKKTVQERAPKSSKNRFKAGDILYCKLRPYLNKVIKAEEDGYCSSEIIAITPKGIDRDFLFYSLKSPNFIEYVKSVSHGMRMPRLGTTQAKAAPFFLPPLAEQKRIAHKLEELLSHVDSLKARIDRAPELIKLFRKSALSSATCGSLTGDWRKEAPSYFETPNDLAPEIDHPRHQDDHAPQLTSPLVFLDNEPCNIPNTWSWKKLTEIATLESGHTPRKSIPSYWKDGEIPWISLQDIRAADGKEIFETKDMPTPLGIENSSARLLPKGTVCFSRDISVGFVTIMGRPMATSQHFANWICSEHLIPKYLMFALMTAKDYLTSSGQGSTVKTIYMPALKALHIALPPFEEQVEIVYRLEQLFSFADKLEAKVSAAKTHINTLSNSILAKAFNGELVPQNPSDEPAKNLLARLQAQREAAPLKMRRQAPRKAKTTMHPSKIISVFEALTKAGVPLTGGELLTHSGYPSDASTEQMEHFFLDIREQISLGQIKRERPDKIGQDWFSLKNLKD